MVCYRDILRSIKAELALKQMGFEKHMSKRPNQFSGDQKQRHQAYLCGRSLFDMQVMNVTVGYNIKEAIK